ncbi:nucleotide sugar dehydrogenase [Campylobacter coli]|nr:nucleotide sugar dehydrogenase [Campylobacter coli]HEA8245383.1 nucleotide sugar dehydrogenase [Campylobacter coli]HEF1257563.1 nucleotide sugar dehydrogenase [Campylobacter coli]HEH4748285.1 nucleotide sugar dehydrogenase [Campylobacter coli]
MKIVIIGIGYVGLANAVLFAKNSENEIVLLDVDKNKIQSINNHQSPIKDKLIEDFFTKNMSRLYATSNIKEAYFNADFAVIATPTDYNEQLNFFNTESIENVLKDIKNINSCINVIIKSTVPIGYTKTIRQKFNMPNIIFSPEFLREGSALYDSLYPSRIIVGDKGNLGKVVADLFVKSIEKKNIDIFYMDSDEAESVKLFSNAYLAMRVGFFNEVDSYARKYNLNSADIIKGISADSRIGKYYNNPSFGYGGYCLPKDTKQLLANFHNIPNSLIKAIVESNEIRKKFIIQLILEKKPGILGIYRLIMKQNADNFRNSVIVDIIKYLQEYNNIEMIIYEPLVKEKTFLDIKVENNFDIFGAKVDLIAANRFDNQLKKVKDKVFSADVFYTDI